MAHGGLLIYRRELYHFGTCKYMRGWRLRVSQSLSQDVVRTPCSASEATAADSTIGSHNSNQNFEPCPRTLLSPKSPPMSSTNSLLMARPSPVPPKRRVMEASACVNFWKS